MRAARYSSYRLSASCDQVFPASTSSAASSVVMRRSTNVARSFRDMRLEELVEAVKTFVIGAVMARAQVADGDNVGQMQPRGSATDWQP